MAHLHFSHNFSLKNQSQFTFSPVQVKAKVHIIKFKTTLPCLCPGSSLNTYEIFKAGALQLRNFFIIEQILIKIRYCGKTQHQTSLATYVDPTSGLLVRTTVLKSEIKGKTFPACIASPFLYRIYSRMLLRQHYR